MQLSVAVGGIQLAKAEQFGPVVTVIVVLQTAPVTTGAVRSFTVTVNAQVLVLPEKSVVRAVTVVTPNGN